MFTICPKCALTLAVTAADLRIAQGYVRCGRCSSVFNALARLTDERLTPVNPPSAEAETPPAAAASATPSDPESVPDEALEFNPERADPGSVFVQPQPDPQWAAATGKFKAMIAANQEPVLELQPDPEDSGPVEVEIDASFLATIIQSDAESAAVSPVAEALDADLDVQPAAPAATAAPAAEPAAPPDEPAKQGAPRHAAPHRRPPLEARGRQRSAASPEPPAAESEPGADATITTPALRAWLTQHAWTLGVGLAVLALLVQVVNHNRDALAANPRLNGPLTAVYRAFGVALVPHWDLHAYDVRQLGASADTQHAGQITVRASIRNAGAQAQPLPLLRVTLEDRFGNRIAARNVQPRFYLPGAVPPSALLGAGQRVDAEMAFIDPGASAVGFELDACLPVSGGGVTCANDAASRQQ
jgi:predicted Zn finger-like uncharacterized protein